jgi:hypothetical protein
MLEGRILAYTPDVEGWVAVTGTELARISRRGTLQRLARLPENSASPASVAVGPTGDIAIGRRFFVSVLHPHGTTYEEHWFIPPACQRFTDGFPCECQGGA